MTNGFIKVEKTFIKLTEVNQIDFNLTAVTTHQEGRVSWNDEIKSLEIDTENPDVQVQVGHEMVVRVSNQTGSILTKGTVVYIDGAQGQRPTVTKADYSADTSSASVIGLVAADINNGDNGYVVTSGILEGINTIAYSAGTSLYLFTGGTYSSNKPQAPDHDVRIGKVVVSNATTGSIYVNVQNGYELDELHDVRITSVSENDVLVRSTYNGSPVWVNTKTMSGLTYVQATTVSATGGLNVTGNTILSGLTTVYGDTPVSAAIKPGVNNSYDLGEPSFRWREIYTTNIDATNTITTPYLYANTISATTISGGTMVITSTPTTDNTLTQVLSRDPVTGTVELVDTTSFPFNYGLANAIMTGTFLT